MNKMETHDSVLNNMCILFLKKFEKSSLKKSLIESIAIFRSVWAFSGTLVATCSAVPHCVCFLSDNMPEILCNIIKSNKELQHRQALGFHYKSNSSDFRLRSLVLAAKHQFVNVVFTI